MREVYPFHSEPKKIQRKAVSTTVSDAFSTDRGPVIRPTTDRRHLNIEHLLKETYYNPFQKIKTENYGN